VLPDKNTYRKTAKLMHPKPMFSGVKEFSIDVTELSISVCAIAKRKAGIKVPNIEVIAINFHFLWNL
jgi:hypothetical protein